MGVFVKGDVVVVPFPFSDLSAAKRRPALILTDPALDEFGDCVLAQITSQQKGDAQAISIDNSDFENGSLRYMSNVRPNKLYTASESTILYKAGDLRADKMREILSRVSRQFTD